MKKIFFLLCASFFLIGFTPVLAADSGCSGFESQFNFLGSADKVDLSTGLPKVCTAGSAISWITNLALSFAGVIAVVFIIVGGYMYLTSAGNEEAAEKGRKVLTNAIIGLIIIILSAAIIRIVVNTLDSSSGGAGGGGGGQQAGGTGGGGSGGGGSGGGASNQDLATLKSGFTVSAAQVSFSLPKTSDSAIKAACGVQSIGSNVAVSAKVGSKELGRSGLALQGQNYVGSFSVSSGDFNPQTDTVYVYVCGTIAGTFTP